MEPVVTETVASSQQWLIAGARATLLIVVGLILTRLAANGVRRLLSGLDEHIRQNAARATTWTLTAIVLAMGLHQLGFNLTVLLGAAGVLSVAVGFASQTSASNLISGLFLLGERPFRVGDIIDVNSSVGEVLSIDLLSVKLRTFDNIFVRIPNETIIKGQMRNLSRFHIRRLDIQIVVELDTDLDDVEARFKEVCANNAFALVEPEPIIMAQGINETGLPLQLSVWSRRTEFLPLRNSVHRAIAREFAQAGIRFALPKRLVRQDPAERRPTSDGAKPSATPPPDGAPR